MIAEMLKRCGTVGGAADQPASSSAERAQWAACVAAELGGAPARVRPTMLDDDDDDADDEEFADGDEDAEDDEDFLDDDEDFIEDDEEELEGDGEFDDEDDDEDL